MPIALLIVFLYLAMCHDCTNISTYITFTHLYQHGKYKTHEEIFTLTLWKWEMFIIYLCFSFLLCSYSLCFMLPFIPCSEPESVSINQKSCWKLTINSSSKGSAPYGNFNSATVEIGNVPWSSQKMNSECRVTPGELSSKHHTKWKLQLSRIFIQIAAEVAKEGSLTTRYPIKAQSNLVDYLSEHGF